MTKRRMKPAFNTIVGRLADLGRDELIKLQRMIETLLADNRDPFLQVVNPDDGSIVGGDVNADGDFVGRDKIVNVRDDHLYEQYQKVLNWDRMSPLRELVVSGRNLRERDLSGADLMNADLYEADLTLANLSNADLREAILSQACLIKANLCRASLSQAKLIGAYLYNADLSGADLSGAFLSNAHLIGSDLSSAFLKWTDLREALLSEAILSNAKLCKANLVGAILTYADLTGADLTDANLNEVILTGAKYDNCTCWPYGFTPPDDAINTDETDKNS